MKTPILFTTLGYPGSGKTFFSRRFAKDMDLFHLNSDRLRLEMFPTPKFTPAENATVFRMMDFLTEELGFSVIKAEDSVKMKLGDFTWAFTDENKTPIKNESGLTPKGLGIYSYVEVDDVDEYYQLVKSKGIRSTEPKTWPWGKREFVVKDPDGYKLVFYAPTSRK